MTGEQLVAASREQLWEALNDPRILQRSIPGCQQLDKVADDCFDAVVEVKVGPIGARFKGRVQLDNLDPPNGYVISGQGNGGLAGAAKGNARVTLSEVQGGTLLTWLADVETSGRLTQLGGPVLDATARNLAGRFFERLALELAGEDTAAPPTAIAPVPPSSEAQAAHRPVAAETRTARPWGVMVALALALLTGFLLGRSDAADWWLVVAIVLAGACLLVGFEAGRTGGRRD